MADYRYYLDTLKVGGSANPSDNVYYVDVYNGNDANSGSNTAPKETIQGALNAMGASGADIVLASGFYNEGDFANQRQKVGIIADGQVIIDGTSKTSFSPATTGGFGINYSFFNGEGLRDYGRITVSNFTGLFGFAIFYPLYFYNATFKNLTTIDGYLRVCENMLFDNCIFSGGPRSLNLVLQKNTFINTNYNLGDDGTLIVRSNYFDPTSKIDFLGDTPAIFNHNHFEGTITGKISNFGGTTDYDNIEDFKVAFPAYAINDIASTTSPMFNPNTYSLQEASPLTKGGFDKKPIGAFNPAKAVDASDVTWTVVGVDNTTTPGEAVLTGSPTGTMTSGAIQVSAAKRELQRLLIPNLEEDFALGRVVGVDLASGNTPNLKAYELQYSDDNITYSPWLKIPFGVKPLVDGANKGNGDSTFNFATSNSIKCVYYKLRITLRDNEASI